MLDFRRVVKNRKIQPEAAFCPTKNQGLEWMNSNPRMQIANLFPACAPCNLLKTTYSLEMFRKQISLQVERARKSSMNFRTAERFGQISIVEKPIVFWFEQYSEKNGAIK